ncbi:small subunit ribosomal protein S20 [Desulfohalotomaculum tongense]|uniref:30S ribosomal protein S20 n=1 Tax=Desulforadius tongensis TaxID=1216062 RepID=UPI001957D3D3|nr:30S ribosomal protein S20 [Desulforadius tongensis]MBM7855700.1 small subunit ribosomal protein S20 [Desulforadius tongensis]
MPNTKSAAKRVRTIKKRTLRNARIKSAMRTSIRRFEEALASANMDNAKAALQKALKALDKAVTKGVIHKNTAARKKSRLTKRFNRQAG